MAGNSANLHLENLYKIYEDNFLIFKIVIMVKHCLLILSDTEKQPVNITRGFLITH